MSTTAVSNASAGSQYSQFFSHTLTSPGLVRSLATVRLGGPRATPTRIGLSSGASSSTSLAGLSNRDCESPRLLPAGAAVTAMKSANSHSCSSSRAAIGNRFKLVMVLCFTANTKFY